MPLPVSAGAAHHRLGPVPLRDSGEDLVSEQTYQVEERAAAREGGRGGTPLHITRLLTSTRLLHSDLQASFLPAAHSAPAAGASHAGASSSLLLYVMRNCALNDCSHDGPRCSPPVSPGKLPAKCAKSDRV